MDNIPYKLLQLRKHSLLSQNVLAKELGIDTVDYMAIENGRVPVDDAQIQKLSEFYKIDPTLLTDDTQELDLSKIEIISNDPTYEMNTIPSDTKENLSNDIDETAIIPTFVSEQTVSKVKPKVQKVVQKQVVTKTKTVDPNKKQGYNGSNGIMIAVIVAVIICVAFAIIAFWPKDNKEDIVVNLQRDNNHLLAANASGFIYFDGNDLKYRGDNSNDQFSVSNIKNAVAAYVNNDVSVIIQKDGILQIAGRNKGVYAIENWPAMTNIALGDSFLMAQSSDDLFYCTGSTAICPIDIETVESIWTYGNNYIILDSQQQVHTNDQTTAMAIRNLAVVNQIVSYNGNTLVVYNDGSVQVIKASNSKYYEAEKFTNVQKIVLLNDALFALTKDKAVLSITDNKDYASVSTWSVIDIAGANDYLVGYNNKEIVGVGNNANDKFEIAVTEPTTTQLATVTNIQTSVNTKQVVITFDKVANADYYEVTIGNNLDFKVVTPKVNVDVNKFVEGQTYVIKIKAMSNSTSYEASPIVEFSFVYNGVQPSASPSVEPTVSTIPTETPIVTPTPDASETPVPTESVEPTVDPTVTP